MGSSFYDHDHDHGGGPHDHHHSRLGRYAYGLFCAGVGLLLLLYALGAVEILFGMDLALLLALVAGYPLLRHALSDLLRGHLSSHLTIAVAAGAAVAVGEYFAAAEVMFIMLVGEGIEHYTVDRAKGAIEGFVRSRPRLARVLRDGEEVEVDPAEVAMGEIVRVRAGELVPVDGEVLRGESTVDQSTVTGEPMPAAKRAGDTVWSGSLNEYGVLEIRAERVGEATTLARIARLIRDAQQRRAPIVRTADRLAKYFLPAVLLASGLIYLVTGEMLRTVAALIVACPCALVLATPAAVAAGIARLAREGVLVKGGEVVEAVAQVDAVAFDKTGTLTAGRPQVTGVVAIEGVEPSAVLALAAAAERPSEHLLGRAIVEAAVSGGLELAEAEDFTLRPGLGVEARIDGRVLRVGNLALVREVAEEGLEWAQSALAAGAGEGRTGVVVAADRHILGVLSLRDPLREEAAAAVSELGRLGLEPIVMLTGDEEAAARSIARQAGIREVYARLLPEEKVARIEQLRRAGRRVLMVGDGINDAPSLAAADVGLAMGRGAADLSAEAAQVVFLKDRLTDIPSLLAYARKVIDRIRWSILIFAFGVNFGAVALAAFGLLSPAWAAVLHQGASLAVILNSVRLLVEGRAVEVKTPAGRPGLLGRLRRLAAGAQERLRHARHRFEHRLAAAPAALGRHRRAIFGSGPALLALLWLLSGTVVVSAGQLALVERFGRLLEPPLGPGLHLRWPWPVERTSKIAPRQVRVAELGFRTAETGGGPGTDAGAEDGSAGTAEPAVYEWNTRHTGGRFVQRLEESLMLTGDENLVETYAVVQYAVADPARYLFRVRDAERLVRVTGERILRQTIAGLPLDAILTDGRRALEGRWQEGLAIALEQYESGVEILAVHLEDAHPPVAVVDAFRDVSSALDERSTRIDLAEAYRREQLPLSRGSARSELLAADGYARRRVERSRGESAAFSARAAAYAGAPEVTALRLYLETVEAVLPAKRKYIADGRPGGRRRFLFYDGVPQSGPPSLSLVETPTPGGRPPPPAERSEPP